MESAFGKALTVTCSRAAVFLPRLPDAGQHGRAESHARPAARWRDWLGKSTSVNSGRCCRMVRVKKKSKKRSSPPAPGATRGYTPTELAEIAAPALAKSNVSVSSTSPLPVSNAELLGPKKISETLVEFAGPVTTMLGRSIAPSEFQKVLEAVADVWNGVTFRVGLWNRIVCWMCTRSAKRTLREALGLDSSEAAALVRLLQKRRLCEFAHVKYGFRPVIVRDEGHRQVHVIVGAVVHESMGGK